MRFSFSTRVFILVSDYLRMEVTLVFFWILDFFCVLCAGAGLNESKSAKPKSLRLQRGRHALPAGLARFSDFPLSGEYQTVVKYFKAVLYRMLIVKTKVCEAQTDLIKLFTS